MRTVLMQEHLGTQKNKDSFRNLKKQKGKQVSVHASFLMLAAGRHPLASWARCTYARTPPRFVNQGCQMAKFDPFLSLDCARVEGVGAQSQGRDQILPSDNPVAHALFGGARKFAYPLRARSYIHAVSLFKTQNIGAVYKETLQWMCPL